ncbi:hypothetical protein [Mesorhizobium sp. 1B3]|uniref:hypothetical protein n=1 Tax=Mesorhizobium sp. 1B3 TaxID=3243599 RepID=UPI003D96DBE3
MFLKKQFNVPKPLHAALGQRQSGFALMSIAGFGVGNAVLVLYAHPDINAVPIWQAWVAAVLIFDIGAGCIANFTQAVQAYYRRRPRLLLPFLAGHVHLLLIAALLGLPLSEALGITAYTLVSAAIVGCLDGERQKIVAALLLGAGLLVAAVVASATPAMLLSGQIFMLKLTYAHAVDHHQLPRQAEEKGRA